MTALQEVKAKLDALPEIGPGYKGEFAVLLRRALHACNFGPKMWVQQPPPPKSDEYTNTLRDTLMAAGRMWGIDTEGKCTAEVWRKLASYAPAQQVEPKPAVSSAQVLRAAIVTLARQFVGVQERGHNAGPEVQLFQRWAGGQGSVNRHDAWCAAFCDYVYENTCKRLGFTPLLNIGLSVPQLVERARQKGLLYTDPTLIRAGDLWVWKHGSRFRHVEIITGSMVDGKVPTIGGNTSAGRGSVNEGDGVYERTRDVAGMVFVRLA